MTSNLFGLHGLAFSPLWHLPAIREQLPALVEQGVGLFEIPLLRPDELDAEGSRKLAASLDVELICSLGLPAYFDIQKDQSAILKFLDNALDVTARAGASALSGVTYSSIGSTTGAPPTTGELDAVARIVEGAAKAAASRGLRLGIEPCNRYETHLMNRAVDGRRMIEKVGADNVFIHLDTYHMNIEEASALAAFEVAGEHLGYLHLSESHRGVPGQGSVDWAGIFSAADQVGYDGPMTLESFVHLDADIASALAIWRPVAEQPEQVLEIGIPFLFDVAEANGVNLTGAR